MSDEGTSIVASQEVNGRRVNPSRSILIVQTVGCGEHVLRADKGTRAMRKTAASQDDVHATN